MLFKKRIKKVTREQVIESLKSETQNKLNQLPKNDLNKLVKLVRHFFAKFFRISYNFTSKELDSALDSKKISEEIKNKIKDVVERQIILQFGKEKPSQDVITNLHTQFKEIINSLSESTSSRAKKNKKILSPFKHLLIKFKNSFSFLIKILKNTNKPNFNLTTFKSILKTKKTDISGDPSKLYDIIFHTHKLIKEGKHDEAKQQYGRLLKAYSDIPEEEKKKAYFHLKKLYEKITSSFV